MPDNIYPDLSNDNFDIKYAQRKIMPSDLRRVKIRPSIVNDRITSGGGGNIIAPDDNVTEPVEIPIEGIPNDEEYIVNNLPGENYENFRDGETIIYLRNFRGLDIKPFRNGVEQFKIIDYTWNSAEAKLTLIYAGIVDEVFIIQGHKIVIPLPENHIVVAAGENINFIVADLSIAFLTTFVNVRIRVYRNGVVQSAVTEFSWNPGEYKLTLIIPPVFEEEFKIEGY